jgi:hypothetical protein
MTDQNAEREGLFQSISKTAAASPELLRVVDIDRLLALAKERGLQSEFVVWLRAQPIPKRTRQRLNVTLKEETAEEGRTAAREAKAT